MSSATPPNGSQGPQSNPGGSFVKLPKPRARTYTTYGAVPGGRSVQSLPSAMGRARRTFKPLLDVLHDAGKGGGPGVRGALNRPAGGGGPIIGGGGGGGGGGGRPGGPAPSRGGAGGPPGGSPPVNPNVIVNVPKQGASQFQKNINATHAVIAAIPSHEPGDGSGGGFHGVNRPLVVAVVVIAGVGSLHAKLTGGKATPVLVGSGLILIFLSLLDLFGGPLSVIASGIAMVAMVAVLLQDLPAVIQALGRGANTTNAVVNGVTGV